MPTFGVTSTFGVTAPTGFLQSSEKTQECETATIKGPEGKVEEARQKPRSKTTITVRSKGAAALATVVPSAADFSTLTLTSTKFNETNDDFPTSEVVGTLFD
jgi:hypothetical protein